tara:strand:- start:281 stop:1396 length:1116 start_codon:yes stop_codon:yes gene_type:complete
MKKVAFIYFDDLHHINHFVGVAVKLSNNENLKVDVLTYKNEHKYLKSLIKLLDGKNLNLVEVYPNRIRRIIDKLRNRRRPSALFLTKHNKKIMKSYDFLVFTDFKTTYFSEKDNTKFIYLSHGSGDRAYGYNIPKLEAFDLLLLAGNKIVERALNEGMMDANYKIVGYPKFDIALAEDKGIPLFNNSNKTILYNPHNSKELSSWYKHGFEVLEFFYHNKEYNLIFAPHMNLFNGKNFLKADILDQKYFKADNIHMDTGSEKSSNMSYTLAADIYLGDVSSQIYEFIYKQRPCLFLNSNAVEWKNDANYLHWNLGSILSNPKELKNALQNIDAIHEPYKKTQKEYFEYTFHLTEDMNSSARAAKEINLFIEK